MKTVKVRIPVAVYPNGDWGSEGCSNSLTEGEMLAFIDTQWGRYERSIVWITAEVPIPEPVEASRMADSP